MSKCTVCGTAKKPLFTGEYCPNDDCGKPKKGRSSGDFTISFDPGSVLWYGPVGTPLVEPSIDAAIAAWGDPQPHMGNHFRQYTSSSGKRYCFDCGKEIVP